MKYQDRLQILLLYEKIDNLFHQNGYSHKLKIQESDDRFIIWFEDENNYHVREFGRISFEKTIIFLTAYLHALEIGLM